MSTCFDEDDLLPLSALQHLAYCERQCALIHIEGAWAENRLTAEGRHLHERVHEQPAETRDGVRIARGLALRSFKLGLIGKADVVEFHRVSCAPTDLAELRPSGADGVLPGTVCLPGFKGMWRPFPVEYKRGRPKRERCDEIQVCAQALCLEEMLGVSVPEGALFYGATRRRKAVVFDTALRETVESSARRLHALVRSGQTPAASAGPKCRNCSLRDICLPKVTSGRSAIRYLRRSLTDADRRGDHGEVSE